MTAERAVPAYRYTPEECPSRVGSHPKLFRPCARCGWDPNAVVTLDELMDASAEPEREVAFTEPKYEPRHRRETGWSRLTPKKRNR